MSQKRPTALKRLRIGIYAGAFDPVHAGHVSFALQALASAGLDEVVFLPERRPRQKPGVEHYAHRVAMLRKALQPHPALSLLETVERHSTVRRTLPMLRALFPGAELMFLLGSDSVMNLPDWTGSKHLLRGSGLVVGLRAEHREHDIAAKIAAWDQQPAGLTILPSYAPHVSSSRIREALRAGRGHTAAGLLASVQRYARQEWLYVSPGNY